jgi:small-conductance mechanosensitive channel
MTSKLLALKLFSTGASAATAASEDAVINTGELISNILGKFIAVIEGVVIIVAGIMLVRFLKHYFEKIETTHERQKTAINLFEKITNGFIIVMSVTFALKTIGLDLTVILSAVMLGLSFGLRDIIKNYIAGLLILFKAPFELGDIVKIRSFTGRIEKIEFQSVTIRTFDRKEITIHNSDLLIQPIINFSKTEQRRLEISITLGYGSDVGKALKIFDGVLSGHPSVLKMPKYSIMFSEFRQNGIAVQIRFWVQRPCNPLKIRSELSIKMQEAFDENMLLAPFNREAGLAGDYGMTAERKERLKLFFAEPTMADIAGQTIAQVAAATVPVEEYADAEEPE